MSVSIKEMRPGLVEVSSGDSISTTLRYAVRARLTTGKFAWVWDHTGKRVAAALARDIERALSAQPAGAH